MIDWNETKLGADNEITLISLSGDLDTKSCDYLSSVLVERVEGGCNKLVLDCHRLDYITSLGLGMLLRVHAKLRKQGGDVALARVHGPVAEVFHVVRLDKLFHLYPTVQEAVESIGEESKD
jgi:anti-sigma B factor antagonist